MHQEIESYISLLHEQERMICRNLAEAIEQRLPAAVGKVWHGSPVWFIDDNPIVGISKLKNHVQLLFWSGQSFDEAGLKPAGKHKAAEATFTEETQIDSATLAAWLEKAERIQWDYKNIVKRNGELVRLK